MQLYSSLLPRTKSNISNSNIDDDDKKKKMMNKSINSKSSGILHLCQIQDCDSALSVLLAIKSDNKQINK